jgi:hypothetical protein
VLHAGLYGLRLKQLTNVGERREVFRLAVVTEHVILKDRVALIIFLVREHNRSKDASPVFRTGERLDGAHIGKRLEPEPTNLLAAAIRDYFTDHHPAFAAPVHTPSTAIATA